ncbi:heavy metal-associated domain-containing protein [Nonomuraea sp. B12E4]|uniref:Copper chaperone CopZ n=1 Tax=Nonomuraea jiangxiensis TaxID=633440 RepID=A0A1G8RWT9_9ACTN|nr:heavy metal-associated domain-containing protein [Nonomuraea jiangxiensis]SDJ20880.1 Copper chaperone CopZ [Nonomuraea jiangxiensis]
MSASTYKVSGMTCSGCAGKVTAEIRKVAGVSSVDVDLATGQVTVTSDGPLDDEQIRNVVEEVGYEVVPA